MNHEPNPALRLLEGEFYADGPHPHFAWMRREAPVYWDPAGAVWGVALHADVMRLSKEPEVFLPIQGRPRQRSIAVRSARRGCIAHRL